MIPFRVRWGLPRLFSLGHYRRVKAALLNPAAFYRALVSHLVPGLFTKSTELRLRAGGAVRVRSFTTLYVFGEIFLDGIYDVSGLAPKTILDIGANTGLFTLRAKQLWPRARIIAFEPEPGNFADLCYTVKENALPDVTVVNAAVMDQPGNVLLYRHPRNAGGHSTVHRHSSDTISVPAQGIEAVLDLFPEGRCSLLKLDCEGAEGTILRALTASMARRIDAILYEPEPSLYSVDALNEWLGTLGFQCVSSKAVILMFRKNDLQETVESLTR